MRVYPLYEYEDYELEQRRREYEEGQAVTNYEESEEQNYAPTIIKSKAISERQDT